MDEIKFKTVGSIHHYKINLLTSVNGDNKLEDGIIINKICFTNAESFKFIFNELYDQFVINTILDSFRRYNKNSEANKLPKWLVKLTLNYSDKCIIAIIPNVSLKVILRVVHGDIILNIMSDDNRNFFVESATVTNELISKWNILINRDCSFPGLMERIRMDLENSLAYIKPPMCSNNNQCIKNDVQSLFRNSILHKSNISLWDNGYYYNKKKKSDRYIFRDGIEIIGSLSLLKWIKQIKELEELAMPRRIFHNNHVYHNQFFNYHHFHSTHQHHHYQHKLQRLHAQLIEHRQLMHQQQIDASHVHYQAWAQRHQYICAQIQHIQLQSQQYANSGTTHNASYYAQCAQSNVNNHNNFYVQSPLAKIPTLNNVVLNSNQITPTAVTTVANHLQNYRYLEQTNIRESKIRFRLNTDDSGGKQVLDSTDTTTTLNDAFSDLEALAAMGKNEGETTEVDKKVHSNNKIKNMDDFNTILHQSSSHSKLSSAITEQQKLHQLSKRNENRKTFDFIPESDLCNSLKLTEGINEDFHFHCGSPSSQTPNSEESQRIYETDMINNLSDEEPETRHKIPTLLKQKEVETAGMTKTSLELSPPRLSRQKDNKSVENSLVCKIETSHQIKESVKKETDKDLISKSHMERDRRMKISSARNKDIKNTVLKGIIKRKTSATSTAKAIINDVDKSAEPIKLIVKLGKQGQKNRPNSLSSSPSSTTQQGAIFSNISSSTSPVSLTTSSSSNSEPLVRLSSHAAPPSKSKSMHSKIFSDPIRSYVTPNRKRTYPNVEDSIKGSGITKKRQKENATSCKQNNTTMIQSALTSNNASCSPCSSSTKSIKRNTSVSTTNSATTPYNNNGNSTSPSSLSANVHGLESNNDNTPAMPVFSILRNFKIPKVADAINDNNTACTSTSVISSSQHIQNDFLSDKINNTNNSNKSANKVGISYNSNSSSLPPQAARRNCKVNKVSLNYSNTHVPAERAQVSQQSPQHYAQQHSYRPNTSSNVIQKQRKLPTPNQQMRIIQQNSYVNQRKPSALIPDSDTWAPAFAHHQEMAYQQLQQQMQNTNGNNIFNNSGSNSPTISTPNQGITRNSESQIVGMVQSLQQPCEEEEEPSSPNGLLIAEDD